MNLINTSEYWLQSLHAKRDSMNLDKLAENLYRPNIKVPMPIREQKDEPSETMPLPLITHRLPIECTLLKAT